MSTVIGPVKFRPDGTGVVIPFIVQWQKGEQEVIWPKKYASAPFIYPMPKWSER
jgi:branched-chain amino acid transport system substrate-binding protein